jgi:hypothetical protein
MENLFRTFIPPPLDQNKVAGDKANSSQDAQAQQQGQPTAAQQAQGGTAASEDGGSRLPVRTDQIVVSV